MFYGILKGFDVERLATVHGWMKTVTPDCTVTPDYTQGAGSGSTLAHVDADVFINVQINVSGMLVFILQCVSLSLYGPVCRPLADLCGNTDQGSGN